MMLYKCSVATLISFDRLFDGRIEHQVSIQIEHWLVKPLHHIRSEDGSHSITPIGVLAIQWLDGPLPCIAIMYRDVFEFQRIENYFRFGI